MKRKCKIGMIGFLIVFLLMSILCWIKPAETVSVSERRQLQQFPQISVESVTSGTFMTEFEAYVSDQFPFRDTFRKLKSLVATTVLGQQDDQGIYVENGNAVAMEYPLDEKSLEIVKKKIEKIQAKYLKDSDCKVYFSIIPDKNYYYSKEHDVLAMDYEYLFSYFRKNLKGISYIDITNTLSLEDYYRTDSHWRQENLSQTADKLAKEMGFTLEATYEKIQVELPFYGVYANQVGTSLEPDMITYLTNQVLESCIVYDYEHETETTVYDLDKLQGDDLYEMYLSGPISLMTIENPMAETDKELILFRDSFGSSIAPLLIEGYQKITLVDIRYIQSDLLDRWITFENQDVLFLYQTSVLNHGEIFK